MPDSHDKADEPSSESATGRDSATGTTTEELAATPQLIDRLYSTGPMSNGGRMAALRVVEGTYFEYAPNVTTELRAVQNALGSKADTRLHLPRRGATPHRIHSFTNVSSRDIPPSGLIPACPTNPNSTSFQCTVNPRGSRQSIILRSGDRCSVESSDARSLRTDSCVRLCYCRRSCFAVAERRFATQRLSSSFCPTVSTVQFEASTFRHWPAGPAFSTTSL